MDLRCFPRDFPIKNLNKIFRFDFYFKLLNCEHFLYGFFTLRKNNYFFKSFDSSFILPVFLVKKSFFNFIKQPLQSLYLFDFNSDYFLDNFTI